MDTIRPGGRSRGVCWIDLGTPDIDATATFYSTLFGWDIGQADPAGYRLAALRGHFVAALGPAEDAGPPYWTVYAATRDVRTTCQAAIDAGGTVVAPPAAAGDAGIAATIRDHAGAPLSLWQAGTHRGTWDSRQHGALAQVQLRTQHPAEHAAFLRDVLGWQLHNTTFTVDGQPVAFWDQQLSVPTGSPWLVHFHVDNVQRAVALGATTVDAEAGILLDPAGAALCLQDTQPAKHVPWTAEP